MVMIKSASRNLVNILVLFNQLLQYCCSFPHIQYGHPRSHLPSQRLGKQIFFHSYVFFPLSYNDNNYMTYKWPNSSFFNFQENANQENCRQYSSIIFSIDKFGNKEPHEQKIYGWTEFFKSWTITSEKVHTGARAREQKYIYLSRYLSVWKPFWKRVYIYICICIYIYIYIYIYICS